MRGCSLSSAVWFDAGGHGSASFAGRRARTRRGGLSGKQALGAYTGCRVSLLLCLPLARRLVGAGRWGARDLVRRRGCRAWPGGGRDVAVVRARPRGRVGALVAGVDQSSGRGTMNWFENEHQDEAGAVLSAVHVKKSFLDTQLLWEQDCKAFA